MGGYQVALPFTLNQARQELFGSVLSFVVLTGLLCASVPQHVAVLSCADEDLAVRREQHALSTNP